ncbi:MAG: hypothetical protein NW226_09820 [Microscillaceae bacterium]|nr:hypothetical protein [Microscillaceae bacterium]
MKKKTLILFLLMEALIKKIAEAADISEDKAKIAAEAAIEFIKERVAHSIDTKVEQAVKNMAWTIKAEVHEAVTGEPAATFTEKFSEFAEDAKEKLGDLAEDTKEKLGEFAKSAKSFFSGLGAKKTKEVDKKEDDTSEEEKKD